MAEVRPLAGNLVDRFRRADQKLAYHQGRVVFYAAERRAVLRELLAAHTQRETAAALGLSQQRVQQLIRGADHG